MKKVIIKGVSKKVAASDPHTEEIKRYIGFVTETFQDRVSAIAEQFLGLNKKIDDNHNELNHKIDAHTEMIGRLMLQAEDIKLHMQEKVSREDFNKLESRLVSLETFVFSGKGFSAPTSKRNK